jgi:hypothetical protein
MVSFSKVHFFSLLAIGSDSVAEHLHLTLTLQLTYVSPSRKYVLLKCNGIVNRRNYTPSPHEWKCLVHIDPHSIPSVVFFDDADGPFFFYKAEEEDGSVVQKRSTGRR